MSSFPASSESTDYYGVHTGAWVNWSDGPILGATITLNRRDGGLLVSFIALFVTLTGTAFWRISCFILHHRFSSEAPRDGLYHQRQAILRNAANGATGIGSFVQTAWVWRGRASGTCRRMLPLMIFTAICISAFATAGIFSSRIATSTGSQVLVTGRGCGAPDLANIPNPDVEQTIVLPYNTQRTIDHANYAQQCYMNNSSPEECNKYVRKRLSWSEDRNARCPFGEGLCKNELGNLELDTGFVSSDDVGRNDPPSQRFMYRYRVRCAPLTTSGRTQSYNYSGEGREAQYQRYYFGEQVLGNITRNFTYEYEERSLEQFTAENFTSASQDYSVGITWANFYNGSLLPSSSFMPLPGFLEEQGDLILFILSPNFVLFTNETDDPWYSAHQLLPKALTNNLIAGTQYVYTADEPASFLACHNQHQVCNPSLPEVKRCTPLGSPKDTWERAADLWSDPITKDLINWFSYPLGYSLIANVVISLGISSLPSRWSLSNGFQGPIPTNQWQLDVQHWFQATLAAMQELFVELATGPSNADMLPYISSPDPSSYDSVCKKQKILTTAYTNINALGLGLTLSLGTLIILLSYTLEPLALWYQRRRALDTYARLEWAANETLQLQRLAHEQLGAGGPWRGGAAAVPYTEDGTRRLAMLDLADQEHPRLKLPPVAFEDEKRGEDGPGNGDDAGDDQAGKKGATATTVETDAERRRGSEVSEMSSPSSSEATSASEESFGRSETVVDLSAVDGSFHRGFGDTERR